MIKIFFLFFFSILPIQSEANSKLSSLEDLNNKRIGVLMGSAHESYATKTYPNANVLQYKSLADVVLAVKTGKVDAAIYDADPLKEIFRIDKSLGLLGESLLTFDVGVGFRRDNNNLKSLFNKYLEEIKKDGTHKDMIDRWMNMGATVMPVFKSQKSNGTLVVGISSGGLPFSVIKDNELTGFDIELVKRFAMLEGKEIKFSDMDFSSLISAVSSGKVDMIVSSIFVTDERKKQINFSDSYYKMGTQVFALKENIATSNDLDLINETKPNTTNILTSVEDIKSRKMAVLLGSTHDVYAQENFPTSEIMQYKSPSDVVLAVKTGKVDVGIWVYELLIEMLQKDDSLALFGDSFGILPVGYAFNKNNTELKEKYNEFLASIKKEGVYDEMVERWVTKSNYAMPSIDTPAKNGTLIVGHVSDSGLPFVAIKDNKLIGFNIELTKRFAAFIGKDVRFDDMDFGSLIPALSAGKIDIIGMTINITDERKKKVDFGDPFYETRMHFFALKKNIATYNQKKAGTSDGPNFFKGVADSFYSNIIQEKRYLLLWDGFKTTVSISILATIFGTFLGSFICFLRMSESKTMNIPAKIYISIVRGTPVLVILMLIFYVVFASVNINPIIVATIAFGLNFGAYAAEIFRSGIESIEKGQAEAGIAMGFNKIKTFIFIILPQTIRRILPVYKGEFISLVKMTSIVGYIAVQDLTKASDIIRSRTFDAFFPLIMIAILYFLISWILMQSLDYLERVTDPKYKRKKRLKS